MATPGDDNLFQSLLTPPRLVGIVLVVGEDRRRVIDYRTMEIGDLVELLDANGLLPSQPGGQGGEGLLSDGNGNGA